VKIPSISVPAFKAIPETVEDPFLVTFVETKVTVESVKQVILANLPVWAFVSVMIIPLLKPEIAIGLTPFDYYVTRPTYSKTCHHSFIHFTSFSPSVLLKPLVL